MRELICAEGASRLQVSVGLERLGRRALEEGRRDEGIGWLKRAAEEYLNPAAMSELALLHARGEARGWLDASSSVPGPGSTFRTPWVTSGSVAFANDAVQRYRALYPD